MSKQINDLNKSLEEQLHLNEKQGKTDTNLKTNDKTIVGAINELFQNVDSGKNIIADAIDVDGVTGDSTFAAMGEAIEGKNTEISNLKTELAGKVTPAGTAVASNVLSGKTFINSTGQTITGTMTEYGYYTEYSGYLTTTDEKIFLGIKTGAYLTPTGSGYPEITIPKSVVNNLSPENIVSGKEILGVWGTASTTSYVSGSDSTYKSTPGKKIVERVTIQTNLGFVPSNLIVRFKSNSSYGYEMRYFTVCSALNTNKATGVFFNMGISAWFYLENVNANSFDIVSEVNNQNYSMRYSEIQWMAYK